MGTKFKHQKKFYPETTVNVDTSIVGSGGVSVSLGDVDPAKSEKAWARACKEAKSHADRVVLAYQYLGESNQVRNDDFLTPDATIPYTMKGEQRPQLAGAKRAIEAPKPKAKPKKKPVSRELIALREELAELKQAQQDSRRLETKPKRRKPEPVFDYDRELAEIEAEYQHRKQAADSWVPAEPQKPRQIVPAGEKMYTEQEAVEAIKKGFASLGIPNLGPSPGKPAFRVQFDLGSIGKQEAWYHWVSEHESGLFLIYDTRFEYGIRYSPPQTGLDKTITVILPDHNKSYVVHSIDLVHPFGVFSITNLLRASKSTTPVDNNLFGYGPPQIKEVVDYSFGEQSDDGEEWRNPGRYYTPGEHDLQEQLRL